MLIFFTAIELSALTQVVAVVVKYADNVLKGFATSISIVLSCLVSSYFFRDTNMNAMFVAGAATVTASAFAFSYYPPPPATVSNAKAVREGYELDAKAKDVVMIGGEAHFSVEDTARDPLLSGLYRQS